MKFSILFSSLGLIFVLASSVFDINYLAYENPIPYGQWGKISFYDFRGLKHPLETLDGDREFAFIKTSREIQFNGKGTIKIITCFHPSRSYVFAQDIRSNDLLQHELYHFHIAEYCSRLMRREIALDTGFINTNQLKYLAGKYEQMETGLQRQYDEDSYHSYILQQQKRWERQVDEELSDLKKYEDTVLYFKQKE